MLRRLAVLLAVFAPLTMPAAGHAARARTGSIDAFVVLDESGSMKPIFTRVTAYLADAIVRDYLEPKDYVCVVGFSDLPRVRVSQQLASTAEKDNLVELVRNLNVVPQGYTDMGRALEESMRQLERLSDPSHEQVVLILTDGLNQPPRDSPYYQPVRADTGAGFAPPSGFNARFSSQVQRLAAKGWRVHVVGIGADTDARKLAEALGAGYTILREFNVAELSAGLARFWDDTINLAGLDLPERPYRGGETMTARVRLRSTSDKDREVHLKAARFTALQPLRATAAAAGDPAAFAIALPAARWAVPAGGEAAFDVPIVVPAGFPAGDYRATLAFDLESAVKFYPPHADLAFHVPSFWELHGTKVIAGSIAFVLLAIAFVSYRRRPIPVVIVIEGESTENAKPVRFGVSATSSVGGGATDRFRIPGLPQKIAVLERRSVDRFALLSTKPDLVPTIPEYTLGDPIDVRVGAGPSDRKSVRFVRWQRRAARPRASVRPAATRTPPPPAGGIDFR
jgi:Mg-chelatase subunit ChlD